MGNMGLPMASNLQKKGFEVKGYDLSEKTLAAAKELGITPVNDVTSAVKDVN